MTNYCYGDELQTKDRGMLTEVHLADLHFGAFDPKKQYNILMDQVYDKIKDIPFDVDYVFVPITIVLYDYKEYFDIIEYTKDNNCNIRSKEGY
jgi:hypothetical protein